MNPRRVNGSTALPFLDLGTRGKWAVNFIPTPLEPRKGTQYTLNRTLGGSQTWSGHFGGKKSLLLLPEIRPWTIQPIDYSINQLSQRDKMQYLASLIMLRANGTLQ
jgi:hypothetical protein